MHEKRISDFEREDFEQLHILLLKWSSFLGIKEVPSDENMFNMVFFIKENFDNFTLAMVKDAFTKAIARKLPNVNPEHYQNFSPLYVGGILTAYYNYTERARKAYIAASSKVEEDQFKVSESDAEKGMPELVASLVEDPERIGVSGEVVYDYLVKLELLELSNEEKKEIMGKAKVEALQRAKTTLKKGVKLNKLLKSIENHPKSKDAMVISLCKKIGLSIYLDKLGQDGRKKLLENVQLKSDERLKIMQEQEQAS